MALRGNNSQQEIQSEMIQEELLVSNELSGRTVSENVVKEAKLSQTPDKMEDQHRHRYNLHQDNPQQEHYYRKQNQNLQYQHQPYQYRQYQPQYPKERPNQYFRQQHSHFNTRPHHNFQNKNNMYRHPCPHFYGRQQHQPQRNQNNMSCNMPYQSQNTTPYQRRYNSRPFETNRGVSARRGQYRRWHEAQGRSQAHQCFQQNTQQRENFKNQLQQLQELANLSLNNHQQQQEELFQRMLNLEQQAQQLLAQGQSEECENQLWTAEAHKLRNRATQLRKTYERQSQRVIRALLQGVNLNKKLFMQRQQSLEHQIFKLCHQTLPQNTAASKDEVDNVNNSGPADHARQMYLESNRNEHSEESQQSNYASTVMHCADHVTLPSHFPQNETHEPPIHERQHLSASTCKQHTEQMKTENILNGLESAPHVTQSIQESCTDADEKPQLATEARLRTRPELKNGLGAAAFIIISSEEEDTNDPAFVAINNDKFPSNLSKNFNATKMGELHKKLRYINLNDVSDETLLYFFHTTTRAYTKWRLGNELITRGWNFLIPKNAWFTASSVQEYIYYKYGCTGRFLVYDQKTWLAVGRTLYIHIDDVDMIHHDLTIYNDDPEANAAEEEIIAEKNLEVKLNTTAKVAPLSSLSASTPEIFKFTSLCQAQHATAIAKAETSETRSVTIRHFSKAVGTPLYPTDDTNVESAPKPEFSNALGTPISLSEEVKLAERKLRMGTEYTTQVSEKCTVLNSAVQNASQRISPESQLYYTNLRAMNDLQPSGFRTHDFLRSAADSTQELSQSTKLAESAEHITAQQISLDSKSYAANVATMHVANELRSPCRRMTAEEKIVKREKKSLELPSKSKECFLGEDMAQTRIGGSSVPYPSEADWRNWCDVLAKKPKTRSNKK